jgi:hypothetical protein
MPAPDSRLKVLMGKNVVSGMRKYPGEGITYSLNALAGLPADLYGIVQIRLLMVSI